MDKDWMVLLQQQNQLSKMMEVNRATERYGLSLSEQDAKMILAERNQALQRERRVEFGEGLHSKLFMNFAIPILLSRTVMRTP